MSYSPYIGLSVVGGPPIAVASCDDCGSLVEVSSEEAVKKHDQFHTDLAALAGGLANHYHHPNVIG